MALRVVLFDRDGTLVVNVPYNGDPEKVMLQPGAVEAVQQVRGHGLRIAMVSNQSGVGRGWITMAQVHAVNARLESLVGPLGPWFICPHAPDDPCGCRKPSPRLVLDAAAALQVAPQECVMIGDKPLDAQAARAAGARSILVSEEPCPDADAVVRDLHAAAALVLAWAR
ncbi:MAG: D-glycero-alpha-D-manno-heptose-1,7-bisphosphate 7-phosphatase [Candidatus Xenobia bacterium]